MLKVYTFNEYLVLVKRVVLKENYEDFCGKFNFNFLSFLRHKFPQFLQSLISSDKCPYIFKKLQSSLPVYVYANRLIKKMQ